jgi:hypothetical protein
MTEDAARKVANVLIGAAAVGVAYYVARTPPLRRAVWRLAVTTITSTLPVWFGGEVRRAWADSGRRAL